MRRASFLPGPGWWAFAAKVLLANLALGAMLAWAATEVDWIALQAHPGQRAAAVAGVLGGVAAMYFAILAACGLRPRHFMRRV